MESHTVPSEPTVRIDALETFVELLSRVESDPSSDAFYSRLCEATCRLADMDRAVIFRYDGASRRVRAAGSFGIPLDVFADAQVTVETVPVARESLLEDRVLEISSAMAEGVPGRVPQPDPRVDAGLHADGRRRPLARRDPVRPRPGPPAAARLRAPPAVDAGQDRRAGRVRPPGHQQAGPGAPAAGAHGPRARGARVGDPAPVRHPARVLSSMAELSPAARERIGAELQAALADLRRALQRPLSRSRARDADDAAGGGRAPAHRAPRPAPDAARGLRAGARPGRGRAAGPVRAGRGRPQRAQARGAEQGRGLASRSTTATRWCST